SGVGQMLNPLQLLWVNLLSDVLPALGLALEPPEPGLLERPPRDASEPLIGSGEGLRLGAEASAMAAAALAAMGYGMARYGSGKESGTLAFGTLVTAQLAHAGSVRSSTLGSNQALTFSLIFSLALQGAALFFPPLRRLLGLAPLRLVDTLVMAASGVAPALLNGAARKWSRRRPIPGERFRSPPTRGSSPALRAAHAMPARSRTLRRKGRAAPRGRARRR
ncbi:MAG TPA: cation-translocating P-type ATPase C-terminal domain-containing protein, partial [Stellaceae bacterium]|nr:cation-translocating P-type ATPase C-terminal domain-containing protein [Stellaceae bacterium]